VSVRPNTGCPLTKRASPSLLNKKEHEENELPLTSRILRRRSQLALEPSYFPRRGSRAWPPAAHTFATTVAPRLRLRFGALATSRRRPTRPCRRSVNALCL